MDLFVSILHLVTVTCICFGLVMLSRAVRSLARASATQSNMLRLLGDAQSELEHRVQDLEKGFFDLTIVLYGRKLVAPEDPPVEHLMTGQQVLTDDPPGDAPWG